ncbi:MAG: hypothetical protein K0B00_03300 [Rhodobacteraceae bacterium]|nr:hypothetical protein [Paracoccaceae bacterium]
MTIIRFLTSVALVGALGGCATLEPVSRSTTEPAALGAASQPLAVATAPRYAIMGITVRVPETLKVSEANLYYPIADIVWRGDARGDRYAQVKSIFDTALAQGTAAMTSGTPVQLEVEVTRFHGLTEKARYSVGGTYAMKFLLTLRDARTGAIIDGPREVAADMPAAGGERALAEEARGLTPKLVVTARLAEVIAAELTRAPGQAEPKRSLLSALVRPAD